MEHFNDLELAEFRKRVGKNVKRLRKKAKMTQIQLSNAMGNSSVSLVASAEIGFGGKKFNADHLYKMSKILGVDICEFFR